MEVVHVVPELHAEAPKVRTDPARLRIAAVERAAKWAGSTGRGDHATGAQCPVSLTFTWAGLVAAGTSSRTNPLLAGIVASRVASSVFSLLASAFAGPLPVFRLSWAACCSLSATR